MNTLPIAKGAREVRQLLECASPLALWQERSDAAGWLTARTRPGSAASAKRQRTAALQNLAEFARDFGWREGRAQ